MPWNLEIMKVSLLFEILDRRRRERVWAWE
jgi:hypothetical protein